MSFQHCFVVPAYKDSPFLEDCVLSLKNQTLRSPILITTATPSDYIKNIAKKHGATFLENPDAPSISGDWNFALEQAGAEYVTLAHQDDIYAPHYTEQVLKHACQQKDTLIVFTDYEEIVGQEKIARSLNLIIKSMMLAPFLFSNRIGNRFFKKAVLSLGDPICCPSVTLHKKALPDFRFSGGYAYVLDWEAWWRLAQKKGAFIYIRKKLLQHRLHQGSETTHLITSGKRGQEERALLTSIWGKWVGPLIARVYQLGQKGNIR